MKPQKGNVWKVKFELENGEILETETENHIGQHINWVKKDLSIKVYDSKVKSIIERWQERRS